MIVSSVYQRYTHMENKGTMKEKRQQEILSALEQYPGNRGTRQSAASGQLGFPDHRHRQRGHSAILFPDRG